MKSILQFIVFISVVALLSGCANMRITSGNEAYQQMKYQDAINNLEKGLAKKESKSLNANAVVGLRNLAASYLKVNKYEQALATYEKLIPLPFANDEDKLNYGKALMSMNNYQKAEEVLAQVSFASNSGREAKILISSCQNVEKLNKDSDLYSIKELYFSNTDNAFSPVAGDGGLYITSTEASKTVKDPYTNQSYTDLYFVENNGETWGMPKKVAGVNGKYHDGVPTFNGDQTKMIFTRSNYIGLRGLGENDAHVNTMQLYQSDLLEDGTWSAPKALEINNEKYMFAHPVLSPDGETLYFSSDRSSGRGGMDLYQSKWENEEWSTPVNLGSKINTIGDEIFPSLRGNDTLYFSSNAHQTLGGHDILYSVNKDSNWSTPSHLPAPINSGFDDFGMVYTDEENGYFSSDRSNKDLIYSFVYSNPSFSIDYLIVDGDTQIPMTGTSAIIKNLTDATMEIVEVDENGQLKYDLLPGKEYEVILNVEGYENTTESISTIGLSDDQVFTKTISLKKENGDLAENGGESGMGSGTGNNKQGEDGSDGTDGNSNQGGNSSGDGSESGNTGGNSGGNNGGNSGGDDGGDDGGDAGGNSQGNNSGGSTIAQSGDGSYIIPNILWDYDDASVRKDAEPYLNDLARLLMDNSGLQVSIESHCDNRGSNAYNDKLSERRAKAVREYLIKKGVPKSMLTSKGFGKRNPIHNCGENCSDNQHQDNRRTEFSIK